MSALDSRPSLTEHPAFALTYVDAADAALARTGVQRMLTLLECQTGALRSLLAIVNDDVAQRAYAPGKWTLAESLIHMADVERVFTYRMLRIARGDKTPLPGFDHEAYVPESRSSGRLLVDILTESAAVRSATLVLVRSLDDAAALQIGTSGNNPVSARALVWMTAGHFAHHLEIIGTRYLVAG